MRSGVWLALAVVGMIALVGAIGAGVWLQKRALIPETDVACPSLPPGDLVLTSARDGSEVVFTVAAAPDATVTWAELGARFAERHGDAYPWTKGAWQQIQVSPATDLGLAGPVRVGDSFHLRANETPAVELLHDGLLVGGSSRLPVSASVQGHNVTLTVRNPTSATLDGPPVALATQPYERVAGGMLLPRIAERATPTNAGAPAPMAPGETRALGTWPLASGSWVLGVGSMDRAFAVCGVLPIEIA